MVWQQKLLVLFSCVRLCTGLLTSSRFGCPIAASVSLKRTYKLSNKDNSEGWSSKSSFTLLEKSILLVGKVATGYGRGSKKLGVPTANLPHFDEQLTKYNVPRGVYFGWCKVGESGFDGETYPVIANIGRSPTFEGQENSINIVEAHIINRKKKDDFYHEEMKVGLVGYLRPEKKFEGLEQLLAAINNDIAVAQELEVESSEETLLRRRALLSSTQDLVEPMYKLGERRIKVMNFLSASRDDNFQREYLCEPSQVDESALWCNMIIES